MERTRRDARVAARAVKCQTSASPATETSSFWSAATCRLVDVEWRGASGQSRAASPHISHLFEPASWRRLRKADLLLRQTAGKFLQPIQPFFDVGHARGVADAQIVIRTKSNAGHSRDLFLFQQPGTEVGGLEAEPGDVREQIERALAVHASEARDAV